MDAEWLDPTEARAWRGYTSMRNVLDAELARGLVRDSGLSGADYEVLVNLSEAPRGRLRVHELAAVLRWERSRLSHQITRMGRRGLVERQACASDGRGSFVAVTEEGLAAIRAAAPAHVANVRRNFFDQLSREQVEMLAELSEAVLAGLAQGGAGTAVQAGGRADARPKRVSDARSQEQVGEDGCAPGMPR